mmetsp:Transcript_7881/g.26815  ORF Transcript_7881/g.26815 Transcript_7881/m.26815 type:complete len:320 (+) Transcript_7881:82-1041(+)
MHAAATQRQQDVQVFAGLPKTLRLMACASLSGIGASLFTHPMDQMKSIMQLNGELVKKGGAAVYSSWSHCFSTTLRNGGLGALYRGISMTTSREAVMNSFRIGLYDPVLEFMNGGPLTAPPSPLLGMAAGAGTAAMGSFLVNPLEICKVRLQVAGSGVGHQHQYKGGLDALASLVRNEGITGAWKGVNTSVVRLMMGSSVQLPVYAWLKKTLSEDCGMDSRSVVTHASCAFLSSIPSILVVNPLDVVRTRIYNQPFDAEGRGLLYRNGVHAAWKIFTVEGPGAFYKGAVVHFGRLAPHLTLIFVMNESLKKVLVPEASQ